MHTSMTSDGSEVSSAGTVRLPKSAVRTDVSFMACSGLARLISPERGWAAVKTGREVVRNRARRGLSCILAVFVAGFWAFGV